MRPTRLEINLSNLKHNIIEVQNIVSDNVEIIAVLKASAYGNGAEILLNTFKNEGINNFAVAIPEEGEKLRKLDKNINIIILNQPNLCEVDTIINNNLTCGACEIEFLEILNKKSIENKKVSKIHIEVDTGEGRNGVLPDNLPEFLDKVLELENIEIEGVFTHLTCADSDSEYTYEQINKFNKALEYIKNKGINIKFIHAANSSGVLGYKQAHFNAVRPGIMLYGYYPDSKYSENITLKPVEKLVSKINYIKMMPVGSGISYDKTFIAERETKIAVVPIGYADGYKRAFSNKADVLINGKRAKVIGKVCMDMIMVDITDLDNVNINDDVYLFDNEEITVEELAKIADTINYEIISTISFRVDRVYINN